MVSLRFKTVISHDTKYLHDVVACILAPPQGTSERVDDVFSLLIRTLVYQSGHANKTLKAGLIFCSAFLAYCKFMNLDVVKKVCEKRLIKLHIICKSIKLFPNFRPHEFPVNGRNHAGHVERQSSAARWTDWWETPGS